jgi:hypothetical protein
MVQISVAGIDWRTPSPLLARDLLSCYPPEMARKRKDAHA